MARSGTRQDRYADAETETSPSQFRCLVFIEMMIFGLGGGCETEPHLSLGETFLPADRDPS
jgi:hypothetical protein